MATLNQLREQRGDWHAKGANILDVAKKENRPLTLEEKRAHEETIQQMEGLSLRIEAIQDGRGDIGEYWGKGRMLCNDTPDNSAIKSDVVLTRDQSVEKAFRSHNRNTDTYDGLTPGAFLRAVVLGPKTDAERRAMSEGTTTAGGYTVPAPLASQYIDKLRANSSVFRAGALTVPMESNTLDIARLATDPTIAWRSENAAVTASDAVLERVRFTAQSATFLVKGSRELVEDSRNIEDMLFNAFAKVAAIEIDRAALLGSGTPPEPKGIKNWAGVGSVSMGTNGAAPTSYANVLDVVQTLQEANAGEATAGVMSPRSWIRYAKLADTTGQPMRKPDAIANLPFYQTTSIGNADTQGTSNVASRAIFGNFADLLIGVRSELRVETLKERYADNMQLGFLAHLRYDIQVAHPESFCQLVGIL